MKYKVGDKVRVKSFEWYNSKKLDYGYTIDDVTFDNQMSEYCGRLAIIEKLGIAYYRIDIDNGELYWYDWMLEDEPTVSDQLKEKRFQAACSAMNGILSTEYSRPIPNDKIVQMSYMLADELLKQGGYTE